MSCTPATCDIPCSQAIFHDQAYYLSLFERLYPQGYLAPLKNPGPGYELLQAYACMFSRLSLAVARIDCGDHILQSFGANFSTATVTFNRPPLSVVVWPGDGDIIIQSGTVVTTSRGDRRFTTLVNVAIPHFSSVGVVAFSTVVTDNPLTAFANTIFVTNETTEGFPTTGTLKIGSEYITYAGKTTGVGTTSFTGCDRGVEGTLPAVHAQGSTVTLVASPDAAAQAIPVIATQPAFEFNVPGPVTTARNELLLGEIDFIHQLITTPPFPDNGTPDITVAQVDRGTCGRPPMLDALGADRGLPRAPGETDDSYRQRIRTLPDVVTPDAIIRVITGILGQIGTVTTWPFDAPTSPLFFDYIETWYRTYQTAFDCPSPNAPGSTTLTADLTAVATTAVVSSTVGFTAPDGILTIEGEQMTYTGLTGTSFTGLTRGVNGTTAAAHASGFAVAQPPVPGYQPTIPAGLDPDLFAYDPDPPYPPYPFENRWLSEEDFRGAFIVVVPNYPAITDVGLGYDDTAINPAGLLTYNDAGTNIGYRSTGAYDLTDAFVPPPTFSAGFYDGFDLGKQAVYKGLWDNLQLVKAAGVLSIIELQGE